MSFTLIGKHEKDSRANRDGYVTAMEDLMKADRNVVHIDCDLYREAGEGIPRPVLQRRHR